MKRSKTQWLRSLAAAMLLGAGLASCSQDDFADKPQGGSLPDGEYPLTLTARVDGMATRTSGKDAWADGDEIGVRIGADGATGHYELNANGSVKEIITPVYWQNTASATVTAWYPYGEQTNVDISDQSEGFAAFDFLTATAEEQNYQSTVSLSFKHQMAKVSYTLQGEGVTDEELQTAVVTLLGDATATFKDGVLEQADQTDGEITSCYNGDTRTGAALLVPQDMTNKPFIKVSINGNTFTYTLATAAAGILTAGKVNTYTITVKADGIEVTTATGGEWNDSGNENVGIKEVIAIYDGMETEPKIGDYYYSDGTWSDGGLRKLYADGTMGWAEPKPEPESGKTVIAIVFHAGHHANDVSDYSSTGIGSEKCHGYAVALTDATSSYCMWGVYGTELGCYPTDGSGNKQDNYSNPDIDWSGYSYTQTIIRAAGGKENLNATDEAGYPATWYAVVDYAGKFNAPANSSGWFLPSIGQMWNVYRNRSSLFDDKTGVSGLQSDGYWSSSEHCYLPADYALFVDVSFDYVNGSYKDDRVCYVRAVLAF